MAETKAFTQDDRPLTLVPTGKSGAEGAICGVAGIPGLLVKAFKGDRAAMREEKVVDMLLLPSAVALPANMTWPLAAVYGRRARGDFIGYAMLRSSAPFTLDQVYSYPVGAGDFDQKAKVGIALEIAKTMERLHAAGIAVGDGNPENIAVTPDGRVTLYDTDSFAVSTPWGRSYRCGVCRQPYVPREIAEAAKGIGYAESPRPFDAHSDDYMLAIHAFRLLNNGAHPFCCALVRDKHDKEMARRIAERESPFFRRVPGCARPCYAPPQRAFPPFLREMWGRAFLGPLGSVPTAGQWAKALERYRSGLRKCPRNSKHYHWKMRAGCPYCRADAEAARQIGKLAS